MPYPLILNKRNENLCSKSAKMKPSISVSIYPHRLLLYVLSVNTERKVVGQVEKHTTALKAASTLACSTHSAVSKREIKNTRTNR